MVGLFNELQPIDSYHLKMYEPLTHHDRQLLTMFYQPLVGSDAMSLYMTLWADAEQVDDSIYNHYHLMNVLSDPLQTIFQARIALEAIGLLNTYKKKELSNRHFIYELIPPLSAIKFFEDPLLSTFLFSKIGEKAYRLLRKRFSAAPIDLEQYEEVSRAFLDVYTPASVAKCDDIDIERIPAKVTEKGPRFDESTFDFNLMRAGLSEQMIPQSALTAVSTELISKLAFTYSLTPLDMQKVVMMAIDENLQLTDARLRRAAADFYKMNISKDAPTLTKNFAVEQIEKQDLTETASRDERHLHYLENANPIEVLRRFSNKEPMPIDVKLAERLIFTHNLPVGVVNVLLEYVYFRNDGKITNNYAERIASHWMSKKISTAREAMEISRLEHDKYMKWKEEGAQPSYQRRPVREEMLPKWFSEQQQPKEQKKQSKTIKATPKTKAKDASVEERRRKLREELKEMSKGVN